MSAIPLNHIVYWVVIAASFIPATSFVACSIAALREKRGPGGAGEALLSDYFKSVGLEHINDFILRRDDGQLVQIDHAVRFPNGIGVVETKNWRGNFVAPANFYSGGWKIVNDDDEEVDVFDGANPTVQNEGHARAVREVVEDVPVFNIVAVVHPEGSVMLDDPETEDDRVVRRAVNDRGGLTELGGNAPTLWDNDEIEHVLPRLASVDSIPGINRAWTDLKRAALMDKETRREHKAQVSRESSGGRPVQSRAMASLVLFASGVACAAGAAAFWLFQWGYIVIR